MMNTCQSAKKMSAVEQHLPAVHISKCYWAVCHLQGWVCRRSTKVHGADGDTGWQSGTGSCSAGILAGIPLQGYRLVGFFCRRNWGTGKSLCWSLRGPVRQTRVGGEVELLWRIAASSFETSCTTDQQAGWREIPVSAGFDRLPLRRSSRVQQSQYIFFVSLQHLE